MSGFDALSLATMQNNLNSSDLPDLNQYIGTSFTTFNNSTQQFLNNTLTDTQLKRACCLANPITTNTNVRIPLFPEIEGEIEANPSVYGESELQYGYFDRPTEMPVPNMCPSGYDMINNPTQETYTNCDTFFKVYCSNIIKEFQNENPQGFDYLKFSYYKPECACFVPIPNWLKNLDANIAPKCLYPGCNAGGNSSGGSGNVWLDHVSKASNCDLTICQANINISGTEAENDISIQNKIEQECGRQHSNVPPGPPGPPVPPTPETPSFNQFIPYGIGGIISICLCFIIIIVIGAVAVLMF